MPPVVWNAGKVIPNTLKITTLARQNSVTMRKAKPQERSAMRVMAAWSISAVRLRNIGTLAIGFMMAEKPMKTANVCAVISFKIFIWPFWSLDRARRTQ